MIGQFHSFFFFFFNDTATTEIYTLSLHDALPICGQLPIRAPNAPYVVQNSSSWVYAGTGLAEDRKSTRLNSSHSQISYAVFCLKKKKTAQYQSQGRRMPLYHTCRDSRTHVRRRRD